MPRTGEDLAAHQDQADRLDASAGADMEVAEPEAPAAVSAEATEDSYLERVRSVGGNILKAIIVDPVGVLKEASRLL